jgi:tetratricopeptide (TPR) repeat protein
MGGQTLKQRLDEVEREQDNLRAALSWWVQSGAALDWIQQTRLPEWAMIFVLVRFWSKRGYTSEGLQRLTELLALPGAGVPTPPRAWLLLTAGQFAWERADPATADTLLQESLAIYRELGDRHGELWCYGPMTVPAWAEGDYGRARAICEQALATAQEIGDEREIAGALSLLGRTAHLEGDLQRGQSLLDEALRLLRNGQEIAWSRTHRNTASDDPYAYKDGVVHLGQLASTCAYCGEVAKARGDYAAAVAYLEESVAISRELGSLSDAVYALHTLGRIALHQGQWSAAATHFGECLAFWQQDGNTEGIVACLDELGAVAAGHGEPEWAARLLGAAAALRESRSISLPPVERADLERRTASVRADLGEVPFAIAWAEGHTMPVERVIAEVLQEAPGG